ncbi:hypothetical protein CWI42_100430 [Ordospora colligata]|uniref:Bacterial surface antigen (D15) domain-containing protein n=1 Tax=Ordospora colligata OC4 TaxID=1354746 RepID=A0A0B2UII9_9MICR|nr:uncharacterized protein M896_100430 [Ordospora colligata OC4]KHN69059.1 hypothetical protein M896_100430 [Ordospora colligata OC4]TBU14340.1 hypothetical protein CWI40_100440 [Ordospora colligata]TBU17966.1 hypothetical protein CWI42_100430 [Ordospora colligata]
MFKITGIGKTDETFITKILRMSEGDAIESVANRLRKLRIFSTVAHADGGLVVSEEKRSIGFSGDTTGRVPKGYFNMRLPNLFGRAENLDVSVSTARDIDIKFSKPFISGSLGFLNIFGIASTMASPHEDYPHIRASVELESDNQSVSVGRERIGYLDQTFLEIRKKMSMLEIKAKAGVFDSKPCRMFVKGQIGMCASKLLTRNVFMDMNASMGTIFGEPHIAERYYLGEGVGGYKAMSISPSTSGLKIGGGSFIEIAQRIGLCVGGAKAYMFGSLGCVSEGKGVVRDLLIDRQAYLTKNNECLGASVGVGISVPVMRSKDGPVIKTSFAIPLTDNEQVQRLQFGFDMDF